MTLLFDRLGGIPRLDDDLASDHLADQRRRLAKDPRIGHSVNLLHELLDPERMHLVASHVDQLAAAADEVAAIAQLARQGLRSRPSRLRLPARRPAASMALADRTCSSPSSSLSADPFLGLSAEDSRREARDTVLHREAAAELASGIEMNDSRSGKHLLEPIEQRLIAGFAPEGDLLHGQARAAWRASQASGAAASRRAWPRQS